MIPVLVMPRQPGSFTFYLEEIIRCPKRSWSLVDELLHLLVGIEIELMVVITANICSVRC